MGTTPRNALLEYAKELSGIDPAAVTEHSLRTPLENLLNVFAVECGKQNSTSLEVQHEPKRQEGFGAPDYKISTIAAITGYVECKKLEETLTKTLKGEQIKKYLTLTGNLLLTNYYEFLLIGEGGRIAASSSLGTLTEVVNRKFVPRQDNLKELEELLKQFFTQPPIGVNNSKALAKALAVRAHYLKDFLSEELTRQEREDKQGRLYGLWDGFRTLVFEELSLTAFADAFAQNLVYGLFLARLNAHDKALNVTLKNAEEYIPMNFELIREMVSFLGELTKPEYRPIRWVVEEVLSILNQMDAHAIQTGMTFAGKEKDIYNFTIKDPYVYFYEDFLAAYDKKLREAKGVYYTPPPVVNYIIRTIDDILRNSFAKSDGFADRSVKVLDFATGTGTFLLEIFQTILENPKISSAKRSSIIRDHLLKNLFGFEYLIAPYTIAHLKLSQYLRENGFELSNGERLQVYLTNTLEHESRQLKMALLPALSREGSKAQAIKENDEILVICGNPPYSGHSSNKGVWITNLIERYKQVDGAPLEEQNLKWLQDDYVKFLRFAQWRIEQNGRGVLGVITNNGFLDDVTKRGMRESLLETFDQLHVIDLHGNSRKKETTLEGTLDENVFDVKQGVAISVFVKNDGLQKGIFQYDLYGKRVDKYRFCNSAIHGEIKFNAITPTKPYYLFSRHDLKASKSYFNFEKITNIFLLGNVGAATGKDEYYIGFTENELFEKISKYAKLNFNSMKVKKCLYRPFDTRLVYYDLKALERPRPSLMKHFGCDNIGIIVTRGLEIMRPFEHAFATENITTLHGMSLKEGNFVCPLFLYSDKNNLIGSFTEKEDNFKADFKRRIFEKYGEGITPGQIFGYIYSVLYCLTYRKKYYDFLRIEYPFIPFTDSRQVFEKVSAMGWALAQAHLMKQVPQAPSNNPSLGLFRKADAAQEDLEVNSATYTLDEKSGRGKLYINKTHYFDSIPPEVYEFTIGGYQPMNKYLKDRKGRKLSLPEIENVENMARVLQFTIYQMAAIDDLCKDWI